MCDYCAAIEWTRSAVSLLLFIFIPFIANLDVINKDDDFFANFFL